ncbi:helix-turn-helix domain-containing protein [Streptomyces sp. NPDC101225]|uniref:helix-turn-helix domain-containing protein n=1 Tax=Streptomyces sp. NPDC101225 TaxID=3366135 RepID=UPI0038252388
MAGNVDLAQFLRCCRDRIDPKSAGIPKRGTYRRVPGLRREEVAQLTDVSTDYYTRLEQGRNIPPRTASWTPSPRPCAWTTRNGRTCTTW